MSDSANASSSEENETVLDMLRPVPTGRMIMMFDKGTNADDRHNIIRQSVETTIGTSAIQIASMTDRRGAARTSASANALVFDRLGLAVVDTGPGTLGQAAALSDSMSRTNGIVSARPEFYVYACDSLRDDLAATWGLKATGATASQWTGRGIKVAVLDTGFNFSHPDFKHRQIEHEDFVTEGGDSVDRQGHGTHCAGTAIGPRGRGPSGPNYGCAPEAALHVGKVLNDEGAGAEQNIFAGIEWALDKGCEIISMSLGRPVQPGTAPDPLYERLGEEALEAGSLIVAASGNDSSRLVDFVAPVSIPANAASIMAVAALDVDLRVAAFSNGSRNPAASGVDIAGPGVRVLSAGLAQKPYVHLSGTSMATPHVAGIAALYAQSDPDLRGRKLWKALTSNAKQLDGSDTRAIGAGLVQAPDAGLTV